MAIRPIDVRRKEFKSGFRGYDANQVDDFLDQVADEFERAYTDNQRMREEVTSLRERLQQFEDLEGSIRSALVHAEQAANDLRSTAQREADDLRLSSQREAETLRLSSQKEAELTIQEAQSRAHQMLSDSSSRVDRVQESYEALQEAKRTFTNDFRQLLRTYMDVMEDMEISTARGIENSLRQRLDTESIAIAREAARSDEPTLGETVEEGPLYETTEPAEDPELAEIRDAQETQPIDLDEYEAARTEEASGSDDLVAEEPEPEITSEEPVVEEGSTEATDETVVLEEETFRTDSGATEEVDREEETLDAVEPTEESEPAFGRDEDTQASDDFFDAPRSEEKEDDGKIFRASRFLRRRG